VLLRALRIEPSYADARYILALQYVEAGRDNEALSQLRMIEENNPDSEQLRTLIASIENGEDVETLAEPPTFNTAEPSVDNESGISVPSGVSTDLFSPVNQGEQGGEL
jgi:tetratricopeptide (TPR) repeat protein